MSESVWTLSIDIDIDSLFYLDSTLSYGNGASCGLDEQSLQDAPASLPVELRKQNDKVEMCVQFRFQTFYCFALFMTLTVFTETTSVKEKRSITIHRQNKMCSVTKVA